MLLTEIRQRIQGDRHSLALILVVPIACLALVLAHSGPSAHDMNGGDGGNMGAAVSMCLGILQVAGVAVAGVLAYFRRRPHRPVRAVGAPTFLRRATSTDNLGFRIRAGPSVLQVFRH